MHSIMQGFIGSSRSMRVNKSHLKSDIYSKTFKLLLIFTPETLLYIDKSNSSTFFETATGKLCTKFKESLENFCKEQKESFSSLEILMDHPCEEMRYQISHTLLEQQEKESLQGAFLQFELTVGKILVLLHLQQFAFIQERA